ncbi:hypothetical protein A3C09_02060 [Candidatus Uhrbacteria bacterium RIFCSPHIGHO2_02_FULL_47_44]|uniref:DUF8128 domain-containing protein n=1 Tax=Candidatus Uhrbacteria bacterium RIFCSPLOWO2_02_FULL_48_18 TaxID=1802408 RepID=A0A1F7VBN6_9BACT|nr:MAG: hypothetical protein A2839_00630 [Candidatus Uhrbacteria bacterium RIFCSPHIGHO2_01_FULL_47_10]OGL70464.1 MAG: hypothetical protein A3C09_02060 [Candidatus Uhrbacteria bacterium RIFCSPHIGHO2_02_FULL_47_44]OGL76844.1 MAG: hypothetical protein A3E97_01715 [Candidatus Uhrbacteria bacterium RIFCSPHIGHO2_12_FULL_47_12]OGL82313.1 MAG: hypothetical protein A3B20_00995 [Candidatus Uhrbacteria bacterium RIFCSPLOWO2_01_FULL_47_17]OGL87960.1 MAG: hypothetical protein A3I41_02525 [Candidatus Uhrbact
MLPLLAIQIIQESAQSSASLIPLDFFNQPIDVIFFNLLLWFGWIPVLTTLLWGFSELWLMERQAEFAAKQKYICLAVDVPSMTEQTPKALENLFSVLYAAKSTPTFKEKWFDGKFMPTFSFEIVSEEGYMQFIIRTQAKFRDVIEAGIYAQYPDAELNEVDDYVTKIPKIFPDEKYDMWGAEFTLDKPSHFPIRTYVDFEDQMTGEIKDPLGYTLEQMSKMKPGEHFWFQLVIQPTGNEWKKAGITHVNKTFGVEEKAAAKSDIAAAAGTMFKLPFELIEHATAVDLAPIFGMASAEKKVEDPWKAFKLGPAQQDEAKAIMRKTIKVGHAVKIRIVYCAQKPVYKKGDRVTMIKGILNQYSHLNLNSFKMHAASVPKDDYFWQKWDYEKKQGTLMKAYQGRSWGIGANPVYLNAEELATLWHFPTISIKAPLIKKAEARRAEPPVGLPITFLENTLPGVGDNEFPLPGGMPMEHHESAESREAGTFANVKEPLPETLPHLKAPTDQEHEDTGEALLPKSRFMNDTSPADASDEDLFTPPDLPV